MAFQGARPTLGDAAALGFISSLGPFAVNAYIPGFHAMAADFGADFVAVEQTMTIYLVTYAVSCLFAGTISDAVGRKPAMAGGMLIFAAASIGALLSTSLLALYFWRFVQGIGASVGQVVSQAIVRDCWSGLNAAGMNGMIAVFFALAPAFAPVIGGWIVVHAGWHGVFALLALYSCLIALYTLFGLPETLPRERRTPFAPMAVLGGYRRCFGNAAFMAGAVSHGLCFMGGILYTAGAADFVISIMGFGVDDFAALAFPLVGTSLIGATCSAALAGRLGHRAALALCCALMIAPQAAMTLVDLNDPPAWPLILTGPVLYWLGMSLARPVMMAMNLDYFARSRGMAASIQQFFATGSFSICPLLWVPLVLGEAWRYSAVSGLCGLAAAVLWLVSLRLRPRALAAAGETETMR